MVQVEAHQTIKEVIRFGLLQPGEHLRMRESAKNERGPHGSKARHQ